MPYMYTVGYLLTTERTDLGPKNKTVMNPKE